jgi:sec-independent protein translocase protein TatC
MKSDEIDDSSAPLIEHLAELRTRILYSLGAFLVAMVACFTVWNPIFNFLTHPICDALAARAGLRPDPDQAAGRLLRRHPHLADGGLCAGLPGDRLPDVALRGAGALQVGTRSAFLPFLIASPVMFLLGAAFAYYRRAADRLRLLPELPADPCTPAHDGRGGADAPAGWCSRGRWRGRCNTCR